MIDRGPAAFDVLAAIDLRAGRAVRLRQGDFAQETSYADDPVAVASAFVDGGVRWLHVVDLDGALAGRPTHAGLISRILEVARGRASVEVAGGLRTANDVARILEAGASRAVVGTAALADPSFAATLVRAHGAPAIAVALDVRAARAVGSAWVRGAAGVPLTTALSSLKAAGVEWFEVTAVARDGTLHGPDTMLLRSVVAGNAVRVIASGGIASAEDLRAVRDLGCAGAIIGRALYDGTLDLATALAAC